MDNIEKKEVTKPSEAEFLFSKKIRCTICDNIFETKMVKSSKTRRMQPDFDLRPRFENIDTLKYDVYACPLCGYAAISRSFEHLTKGQIQLVKDNICVNFVSSAGTDPDFYDYKTAISRYERALECAKVKRAKVSELAYTTLKLSWLYRSLADEMPETTDEEKAQKAKIRQIQEKYYREAYDGFQKALTEEDFPICGMDTFTMDYLLACLASHYKEYSFASKAVSNILSSQVADRRIKDKALDLKTIIVDAIRKEAAK